MGRSASCSPRTSRLANLIRLAETHPACVLLVSEPGRQQWSEIRFTIYDYLLQMPWQERSAAAPAPGLPSHWSQDTKLKVQQHFGAYLCTPGRPYERDAKRPKGQQVVYVENRGTAQETHLSVVADSVLFKVLAPGVWTTGDTAATLRAKMRQSGIDARKTLCQAVVRHLTNSCEPGCCASVHAVMAPQMPSVMPCQLLNRLTDPAGSTVAKEHKLSSIAGTSAGAPDTSEVLKTDAGDVMLPDGTSAADAAEAVAAGTILAAAATTPTDVTGSTAAHGVSAASDAAARVAAPTRAGAYAQPAAVTGSSLRVMQGAKRPAAEDPDHGLVLAYKRLKLATCGNHAQDAAQRTASNDSGAGAELHDGVMRAALDEEAAAASSPADAAFSLPESAEAAVVVPPSSACSPGELGLLLLEHGILHQADAFGCFDGNWVSDTTIFTLLEGLCQAHVPQHTCQNELYEVRVCYLDAYSGRVDIPDTDARHPPATNTLVVVVHTASEDEGQHFSCIIVNASHKLVHVFDTMGRWSDKRARRTVQALWPNMHLFGGHRYQLRNHTGRLYQCGGTCGAWALWICGAYAFNYRGCRRAADDTISYKALQQDPVAFWQAVTH